MTLHIIGRETRMTIRRCTMTGVLTLGISVLALSSAAWAQEPPALREAPGVEDVRQLLLAAYSELREGRIAWRVTTTSTGFLVEAHRVEAPFAPLPPPTEAFVTGAALVDQSGQLESLTTAGTVLDALRKRAAALLAREVRDVNEALKREGAKYAPDVEDEKTASLVPIGIRTLLKTSVVRGHTFRSTPPPERSKEALTWQVELEGTAAGASAFTLVFEPIEGRLMSVVRR